MCGRYGFYKGDELGERFAVDTSDVELRDTYNAAPGQDLPVVRASTAGRTVELMKWGLVPVWVKEPRIGYKMINARSETVFEKPAWRGVIKKRRCLVPARGFYEWQREGTTKKQPYFIRPTDQALFAFAGVYDSWHDEHGTELLSFSILTTTANEDMAAIHDREPVILKPREEELWLDPSVQDRSAIEACLRMYPNGKLEFVKVSTDVNVVKNNDEHLIYPINSK